MFLLLDEVYLMDIFFFHLGMNIQETMKQWDMTRHTVIIYFWVFDRMVKISLSKVYNKFNTKIWFFFCLVLDSTRKYLARELRRQCNRIHLLSLSFFFWWVRRDRSGMEPSKASELHEESWRVREILQRDSSAQDLESSEHHEILHFLGWYWQFINQFCHWTLHLRHSQTVSNLCLCYLFVWKSEMGISKLKALRLCRYRLRHRRVNIKAVKQWCN